MQELPEEFAIGEPLRIMRKTPKLRLRIGKVIAMGVHDRRCKGAIVPSGHDDEVDLQRPPLLGVVLVGDPQRRRNGPGRVPVPSHK